jgi:hypothetical protein
VAGTKSVRVGSGSAYRSDLGSFDASFRLRFASSKTLAASLASILCERSAASREVALALLRRSSNSRNTFSAWFASAHAFFCAASNCCALALASVNDPSASCNETFCGSYSSSLVLLQTTMKTGV